MPSTSAWRREGLAIKPFLELGSASLLCQMVEHGMGLSFLPEYIVQNALAAGTLARLNVPACRVEMRRQLFYHKDKWLTPPDEGVHHAGAEIRKISLSVGVTL